MTLSHATPILIRPELNTVPHVPHGGHHNNLPSGDVLDFSSNINPFGASPRIWDAIHAVDIATHPDPHATPLRHALAAYHQLSPQQVLVGNGAVELIYLLAHAFVRPNDRVLVVAPTFGEYAKAAALMGATIIHHTTTPDFALNTNALIHTLQQTEPRMLFLCNPNNPTGSYHSLAIVQSLLVAAPHTLFVLDEAFINFVPAHQRWNVLPLLHYPNLLVLRSMTKDYALTGLRVGYALSTPYIIAALETVQPPWSVNSMAQAAAVAALNDEPFLRETLAMLNSANHELRDELVRVGCDVVPSAVHCFLLAVPSATTMTACLLTHGILVRDATSLGLPHYIRIATRTPTDNKQLVAAIVACRKALA